MRSERGVAIAVAAALAFTAAACTDDSPDTQSPSAVSVSTTAAPEVQVTSANTFSLDIDPPIIMGTSADLLRRWPKEQFSPVNMMNVLLGISERPVIAGALIDLTTQDHFVRTVEEVSKPDYVDTHRRPVSEAVDTAPVIAPIAEPGQFNAAEVAFKYVEGLGRVTRLRLGNSETGAQFLQFTREIEQDGAKTDVLIASVSVAFNHDGSREAAAAMGVSLGDISSLLSQVAGASGVLFTEPGVTASDWQTPGGTGSSSNAEPPLVRTFQRNEKVIGQQLVTAADSYGIVAATATV